MVALLVLAAAPPAVEAAILRVVGLHAAQGMSPQVTAVWPYDSFHDLRWLLVYHSSVPGFVAEFVAAVLFHGLLSAGLVHLAWPADVPRPGYWWLLRRNTAIAAIALVILSPWSALDVGAGAVSLSTYLFAALVPLLVLAPFLQRAGAVAGWWRGLPSIELVGWTSLNFVLVTWAAAAVWSVPSWWNVLVSAAAGVLNGLLWQRTVRAAVLPRHWHWRRVPVAPIVIALTLLAPAAVRAGTAAKTETQGGWDVPILDRDLPARITRAVIAISGYNSSYDGRPAVDPDVERFSYAGLDAQGRPRPFAPHATHRSLESSADLLAIQVDALHRRTGKPVALVGQSEGAMVIRLYLDRRPDSPVDTALLLSPPVRPGRTYYPPPDARSGWGVVTGWELRAMFAVANLVAATEERPDEPVVRSILDNAPWWRNNALCPVPGVRMIAFVPTASAADAPPGRFARIPIYQVAGFHGGLINEEVVQDRLVGVLAGDLPTGRRPEFTPLQRLAAAWQAPPLVNSINPAWATQREGEGDPAVTGQVCRRR